MSCSSTTKFTNLFDSISPPATCSTLNSYLQPLPANMMENNTSKETKNASVDEKVKAFISWP